MPVFTSVDSAIMDSSPASFTPTDILILSNGPGEITTWVRPVVKALRQKLGHDRQQIRISLMLSPCPNASGKEVAIAQTFPEIDRIQGAADFFPFLLWGKTTEAWDWRNQGVVVFLGGDQLFPVLIGKRLGYRTVIYGEWDTRWHGWIDRFGVMKPELIEQAAPQYRHKFTVVGDLMAGAAQGNGEKGKGEKEKGEEIPDPSTHPPIHPSTHPPSEWIAILPGSKAAKLAQGVPLGVAIAHHLHAARPQTRFVIPVAPTLDVATLAKFADPKQNPVLQYFQDGAAELIQESGQWLLQAKGVQIELHTEFPAYDRLRQCRLCFTTIGANTAELAALTVPMIVLLPTQQLDAMRAWDGLPGLLANLPGMGQLFAVLINRGFLRNPRLLAWPNIWAGEAIVPELLGLLQPQEVAEFALDLLNHPEQLAQMQARLRQVRGEPGAADRLAGLVQDLLQESSESGIQCG
jgi:lipid-A-disaccharide synthase